MRNESGGGGFKPLLPTSACSLIKVFIMIGTDEISDLLAVVQDNSIFQSVRIHLESIPRQYGYTHEQSINYCVERLNCGVEKALTQKLQYDPFKDNELLRELEGYDR